MDNTNRRRPANLNHYYNQSRNPISANSSSSAASPKGVSFNSNNIPHNSLYVPSSRKSNTKTTPSMNSPNQNPKIEEITEADSLPVLIGTCPFMCPEGERAQRERLRDLSVFERLHGNPRKTSPTLAVKKFCRTISTQHMLASDLRPLPVLEDTLNYLLNFVDSADHPFEVVHDFVFDRTRSIRQDLSMQNLVNDKVICMYEKMVKFHVESHHKLQCCGSSEYITMMHHLNMEQLIKALTTLYNLYDANRQANAIYENEAEFRSLYVLLHLDSRSQSTGGSLSLWFRQVPHPIIQSKQMHFARTVLRSFRMGNYKRFFCAIVAEASYLQYCIVERYINEVRAQSLSCINNAGYKLHPYSLTHLSNLLKMKESDLEVLCNACGLETSIDETGNKSLPTKQTTFCIPKGGFQNYNIPGLEQFER